MGPSVILFGNWYKASSSMTALIPPMANFPAFSKKLGYRPPAPETIVPMDHRPVMH